MNAMQLVPEAHDVSRSPASTSSDARMRSRRDLFVPVHDVALSSPTISSSSASLPKKVFCLGKEDKVVVDRLKRESPNPPPTVENGRISIDVTFSSKLVYHPNASQPYSDTPEPRPIDSIKSRAFLRVIRKACCLRFKARKKLVVCFDRKPR